jgi:hypothetical protein
MRATLVAFAKNIKDKAFHVIKQSFVIQKKLRKETQTLATHFLALSVEFKYANVVLSINLPPGRGQFLGIVKMSLELLFSGEIQEAMITDEQMWGVMERWGIWRIIPGPYCERADCDLFYISNLGHLSVQILKLLYLRGQLLVIIRPLLAAISPRQYSIASL